MTVVALLERMSEVLSASFFLFLPFELWARRKKGKLHSASVREMLASASPFLPTVLLGGSPWRSSSAC